MILLKDMTLEVEGDYPQLSAMISGHPFIFSILGEDLEVICKESVVESVGGTTKKFKIKLKGLIPSSVNGDITYVVLWLKDPFLKHKEYPEQFENAVSPNFRHLPPHIHPSLWNRVGLVANYIFKCPKTQLYTSMEIWQWPTILLPMFIDEFGHNSVSVPHDCPMNSGYETFQGKETLKNQMELYGQASNQGITPPQAYRTIKQAQRLSGRLISK